MLKELLLATNKGPYQYVSSVVRILTDPAAFARTNIRLDSSTDLVRQFKFFNISAGLLAVMLGVIRYVFPIDSVLNPIAQTINTYVTFVVGIATMWLLLVLAERPPFRQFFHTCLPAIAAILLLVAVSTIIFGSLAIVFEVDTKHPAVSALTLDPNWMRICPTTRILQCQFHLHGLLAAEGNLASRLAFWGYHLVFIVFAIWAAVILAQMLEVKLAIPRWKSITTFLVQLLVHNLTTIPWFTARLIDLTHPA